jgi:hypothetical protein
MLICAIHLCKTLLRRMHHLKVNVLLKDLHFFLHIDCLCLFVQSICVKLYYLWLFTLLFQSVNSTKHFGHLPIVVGDICV